MATATTHPSGHPSVITATYQPATAAGRNGVAQQQRRPTLVPLGAQPMTLQVRHTNSFVDQPLLVLETALAGQGAELTPRQARALAIMLLDAADDCEQLHPQVLKAPMNRWVRQYAGPASRVEPAVHRPAQPAASPAERHTTRWALSQPHPVY